MTPLIPLGAAALLAYLVFRPSSDAAYHVTPIPPNPAPNPDPPDVVPPPAPPNPSPFPDTQSQATVNATSGLKLRDQPTESGSAVLETMPFNSWVAVLDSNLAPPTAAAPMGWMHVRSERGNEGWASAQYLVFGSDKERRMTPEEEQAYHKQQSQAEAPIYTAGTPRVGASRSQRLAHARWIHNRRMHQQALQGRGDPNAIFYGGAVAGTPTAAKHRRHVNVNLVGRGFGPATVFRRCAAPQGCAFRATPQSTKLGAVVPRGATVQVLRTFAGPKTSPGSPGMGGWSLAVFRGQTGWIPSEWLV